MPIDKTVDLQVHTIIDGDRKGAWTLVMPPVGQSRCGGFHTHTHMKCNLDGFLRMLGMKGEKLTNWSDPRATAEYTNVPVWRYEQAKKIYC